MPNQPRLIRLLRASDLSETQDADNQVEDVDSANDAAGAREADAGVKSGFALHVQPTQTFFHCRVMPS